MNVDQAGIRGFRAVNDEIVDGTEWVVILFEARILYQTLTKLVSYQFVARADNRGRGYFFVLLRPFLILRLLFGRLDRFALLPFVYQGFRGRDHEKIEIETG